MGYELQVRDRLITISLQFSEFLPSAIYLVKQFLIFQQTVFRRETTFKQPDVIKLISSHLVESSQIRLFAILPETVHGVLLEFLKPKALRLLYQHPIGKSQNKQVVVKQHYQRVITFMI